MRPLHLVALFSLAGVAIVPATAMAIDPYKPKDIGTQDCGASVWVPGPNTADAGHIIAHCGVGDQELVSAGVRNTIAGGDCWVFVLGQDTGAC